MVVDLRLWFPIAMALGLTACAQTSRVDAGVDGTGLAQRLKGVALMRVAAASPSCLNVSVLLGLREGDGFKRGPTITVMQVRSLERPAVAEVELEPGEHHVIGYACQTDRTTRTVMDKTDARTYRTSYAHFTVKTGEVVNVGSLQFGASHTGRSAFGRPLQVDVAVADWPLRELDQFKLQRPKLYTRMVTRLMTITDRAPPALHPDECGRMKALRAEGKLQRLPPVCEPTATPDLPKTSARGT
jgi:hypothetical protein